MNKNLVAHLAILLANLIYGINYTFAKDVMPEYIKPFGFIMLRVLGALPLFWLISALGPREKVSRKDLGRLAICAFFGVAANQLLFFAGLNITTPINAAIIMTTNPILVLIAASFILNQVITRRKVLGIALGIVGASALILFKGNLNLDSSSWTGDLLIFLNSMAFGVYLVLVAPLMNKYRPITVIKWVFAFGALYVIPFGFNQFTEIPWVSFTWEIGLKTAFVVFFTTFIAYLFNVFGLKYLKPSTVSTYIYSQPVFAAAVAIMLGKDQITITKIVAAVFIFMGVYLVSKKPKATQQQAN